MAQRFNPAPGWPAPPDPDWLPPQGWEPDPAWAPAPEGWRLVVDEDEKPTRQQKRMERAGKVARAIDPAHAASQTGLFDAYGGVTGRMREAERDYTAIRLQQQQLAATQVLVTEQRETNRLLRVLVGDRVPQQPLYGVHDA